MDFSERSLRIRLPRRWWTRAAVACAVIAVIAVPAAWAGHQFTDVPNSNPHHADISAIALAGITTGCAPSLYCPGDAVTRQQMASFLRRGLGRVAQAFMNSTVPVTDIPVATMTITPGLPPGTVGGAAGFVKADAAVSLRLTDATGCPCGFQGYLFMPGVGILGSAFTLETTLTTVGERTSFAMTGAIPVTTPGAKTVEIHLHGAIGVAVVTGAATAIYLPFGNTGGNTLG